MKKVLKRVLFLVLAPIALVILSMASLVDAVLWITATDREKAVFETVLDVIEKVIPDTEDY